MGKVQPLGNHLGAHQDVVFQIGKGLEQLRVRLLLSGGVQTILATLAVGNNSASSSSMRSVPRPCGFSAVLPHEMQFGCRTFVVPAVMAMQASQRFVHHQWDVAPLACCRVAALGALVRWSVSPPVLEQNHLASLFQGRVHLVPEHLAESSAHAALLVFFTQIRQENFRQQGATKPLGQGHHLQESLLAQPLGFDGRCGRPEDKGDILPEAIQSATSRAW